MPNYRTKFSFTPVGLSVTYGEKPTCLAAKPFNWGYQFSDGSRLVGQVVARLDRDNNKLVEPTKLVADYISTDGKTVLLSWKEQDFVVFDATVDGNNLLLVASSDNFVADSMCLVSSENGDRAQVTHWGIQLSKDEFERNAWSMDSTTTTTTSSTNQEIITIDWVFSPVFPFWKVSFNVFLPFTGSSYHWTLHPCFPFFPITQLAKTAPNSKYPVTAFGTL